MTRLLVIVNDVDSQPGLFLPWLITAGVEFDLRIGPTADLPEPSDLDGYDGLMMFGGGYMPDETDRAPWLAREAELVLRALEEDIPQFGVCLGGQLIAHVTGADVRARTGAPEKGYTYIDFAEAAADDPVFGPVIAANGSRVPFIESHVDRIVALPPEATLLGSSEACEFQAFRIGRAWGTQFHPEAGRASIERWNAARLDELGFDKTTLLDEAAGRAEDAERAAKTLLDAFLAVVRSDDGHSGSGRSDT